MSAFAVQPRLCLILTRALCRLAPERVLEESVRGGADLVQLREKELHPREFAAWAADGLALCKSLSVPMLVNDSVEIAALVGAAGVHLGQEDLEPSAARSMLGPRALIGWSTHDSAQIAAAAAWGGAVNYLGFGPAFSTPTKGYDTGLGVDHVLAAARQAAVLGLPILAIGGIHPSNRASLGAGLGVAVCSALCKAEDPRIVARSLLLPCNPSANA